MKKYRIGFFLACIMIFISLILIYRISYSHALEQQQIQAKEQAQKEEEICYYIKEMEGFVTVYEADLTTVYEYTTILVSDLPKNIQKQIKEGLKVMSLTQVYGFLENYSS